MNIAGIDDMIRVCDYASSMSFVSNPGKRCFIVSFPPTSVKRVHLKRGCSNGQALSLSFFLWTQSVQDRHLENCSFLLNVSSAECLA